MAHISKAFGYIIMIGCFFLSANSQKTNVTVQNVLYTFYKMKVKYDIARHFCSSSGANLVNIKTGKIQVILSSQLLKLSNFQQSRGENYWVGGYRNERNEMWYWEDGTAIASTGRSNSSAYSQRSAFRNDVNLQGPACLGVESYAENIVGNWKIFSCSKSNYFICQKDLKSDKSQPNRTSPLPKTILRSSCQQKSNLYYSVIVILSILVVVLLIMCLIMGKKYKESMKAIRMRNIPRRHVSNTYTYQEFLRPSPDNSEVSPVTRDYQDIANSSSNLSYEVVRIATAPKGSMTPTFKRTQQFRAESATYSDIRDRPNAVIRSKSEDRLFSGNSGYTFMRPAAKTFMKTKTLPSHQRTKTTLN